MVGIAAGLGFTALLLLAALGVTLLRPARPEVAPASLGSAAAPVASGAVEPAYRRRGTPAHRLGRDAATSAVP